jgi:DNA-binding CsgD family transcriptional regulator
LFIESSQFGREENYLGTRDFYLGNGGGKLRTRVFIQAIEKNTNQFHSCHTMIIKFFLYTLTLMMLSTSILLILLKVVKTGGKSWTPFLMVQLSILLFFFSLTLLELDVAIHPRITEIISLLGTLGLIFALYFLLINTFQVTKNLALLLTTGVSLFGVGIGYGFWMFGNPIGVVLGTSIQFTYLVITMVIGFRRRDYCTDPLLKELLRAAFLLGIPFVPLFVIDSLGTALDWNLPSILIDNYSLPLYFLFINGLTSYKTSLILSFTGEKKADQKTTNWDSFNLTSRELELIPYLLNAKSAKEISQLLTISPKTVENHSYSIFKKLNVTSRLEFLTKFSSVESFNNQ